MRNKSSRLRVARWAPFALYGRRKPSATPPVEEASDVSEPLPDPESELDTLPSSPIPAP